MANINTGYINIYTIYMYTMLLWSAIFKFRGSSRKNCTGMRDIQNLLKPIDSWLDTSGRRAKRSKYELTVKIARFAAENGNGRASKKFDLPESSVKNLKKNCTWFKCCSKTMTLQLCLFPQNEARIMWIVRKPLPQAVCVINL